MSEPRPQAAVTLLGFAIAAGGPITVRLVTGEPARAARPAVSEDTRRVFFLLNCLECDGQSRPLAIPFESAAARGKWASEHTRGTGHNRWIVRDEPRPVVAGEVVADARELEAGG